MSEPRLGPQPLRIANANTFLPKIRETKSSFLTFYLFFLGNMFTCYTVYITHHLGPVRSKQPVNPPPPQLRN